MGRSIDTAGTDRLKCRKSITRFRNGVIAIVFPRGLVIGIPGVITGKVAQAHIAKRTPRQEQRGLQSLKRQRRLADFSLTLQALTGRRYSPYRLRYWLPGPELPR